MGEPRVASKNVKGRVCFQSKKVQTLQGVLETVKMVNAKIKMAPTFWAGMSVRHFCLECRLRRSVPTDGESLGCQARIGRPTRNPSIPRSVGLVNTNENSHVTR
jgi:hypothetical protein